MNKIIKKILLISLVSGCNNSIKSSVEPSVKNLIPTICSTKVNAIKVIGRDYFIQNEDESIELKFSSNIKDQGKKPHITFSIK